MKSKKTHQPQQSKPAQSQGVRLLQELFSGGKHIFNMQDAAAAARAQKIPRGELKRILSNLAKRGWLLRLRRGLYVSIGLLSGQTQAHPFAISAYLVQPSAISHWSALQYHGFTEQVPRIITASTYSKVVTPSMRKKRKDSQGKHVWEIAGIHYEYITIQQKYFFGIDKIWIDEFFQIQITDKERTLLDLFIYPKFFGGIGEAFGILEEALADINIEKLVNYAMQYNKVSVIKRLGWALEYFKVPEKYFSPLLMVPAKYYCRLDPTKPAKGICNKRWMIQNNLKKESK